MKVNDYEVPPMSQDELDFLAQEGVSEELKQLYEAVRQRILRHGKIIVRVTRGYVNFKHPYKVWNRAIRQKEERMGTLVNIYFRKNALAVGFNVCGRLISDPYGMLKPTTSFGVCKFYALVDHETRPGRLEELIRQGIYCVSREHRLVRINNKFYSI